MSAETLPDKLLWYKRNDALRRKKRETTKKKKKKEVVSVCVWREAVY